MDHVRAVE